MKSTESNVATSSTAATNNAGSVASTFDNFFSFDGMMFSQIWLILFMLIILVL